MARQPISMRHVKEILRLKLQNELSVREIARSCGIPASTVGDYIQRAEAAGLSWPLPEGISDSELMERLSPPAEGPEAGIKPLPNWPQIREELGRKSVTLRLLWQEYRNVHPTGYGYSRFCELYERWADTLDPVLRQTHEPGRKLFVDWAGQTTPIYHPDGTITQASLFVAVLGFSNRIFAEAFPDQQLDSWISAHIHVFEFLNGVTAAVVPDNPKTAVIHANQYEPLLHPTYQEMAEHYGTVILPARPRKPRDKPKVETGVQIAQRQILATLRDLRFLSVGEFNAAIRPLVAKLNAQPFQKLDGSRDTWFETIEKATLIPLAEHRYELATWSKAKVNIDYHVAVDRHYYSAPFNLIHKQLDVRLSPRTVELFLDGKRVAVHVRGAQNGQFTTVPEHRPKSHQQYLEWTPTRLIEWGRSVGPQCALVIEQILAAKPHPEQGFRSCLGLLRLGKGFSHPRLEAACRRALHYQTCSYRSIKSILENRLDQEPEQVELPLKSPAHENVRGQAYYL
jgi:transposase